jgi:uncharacterized protein (DUF608 family)
MKDKHNLTEEPAWRPCLTVRYAVKTLFTALFLSSLLVLFSCGERTESKRKVSGRGEHEYNGEYTGDYLSRVAFPLGGIGAGMFCIEGTGYFSHMSVRHHPDMFNEPGMFAAISIKGIENGAKVLEGQVPEWRRFGMPMSGKGASGANYGLPRFHNASFKTEFPFCNIKLTDDAMPVRVMITGWSPFIPGDADNSSLPGGFVEYEIENISDKPVEAVFSFHSPNFMRVREIIPNHINHNNGFNIRRVDKGINSIRPMPNGFVLSQAPTETEPYLRGDFAIFTDNPGTVVDHCWYKDYLFDGSTLTWKAINEARLQSVEPVERSASGASLYVPLTVKPHERETVRVFFAWYVPETNMVIGDQRLNSGKRDKGEKAGQIEPYKPWYSSRFSDIKDVTGYLLENYDQLRNRSKLFADAFYRMTLPPEVVEAVAANLTILKSTTVLRQDDGRLWGWEGSGDEWGSCYGSNTHVWNYAQAFPHLFPSLERTLRETEFLVSQNEEGAQAFRSNLPISKPGGYYAASDGQLGGIMKVYRDWRISGDTGWITELYPYVKKSIDYCIEAWDPEHNGYLQEPHHNTYDINFWGPDCMCTSFYLGALTAMVELGKDLGEPYDRYQTLLDKGKKYMESDLFNGEYFYQKVKWDGLRQENPEHFIDETWNPIEVDRLRREGPKHQYGNGCLSDGVIGMWLASMSGLGEILDNDKVTSHLTSVHAYNLKKDLSNHVNPQRPGFAFGNEGGLLLCTWPRGDEPTLPIIYSKEVWTGIEYQVASHLMMKGRVSEGLDIVRACRDRYDGRIRNPFDEYECGHWYARAQSSYSLLQGLTGVRYDAVDSTLYINSSIGDFTGFISAETGFGNVGLRKGKPFMSVAEGEIAVKRAVVSGTEQPLSLKSDD